MTDFRIHLKGTAPLLMHNSRLANPLDPAAKALKKATSKRTKTDDDHEEIARLEHAGSLYLDSDVGPYIPSDNIWRALFDAAKKHKFGVKLKEGVVFDANLHGPKTIAGVNPLSYAGTARTAEALWKDENYRHLASVKIGTSRTMRCRPVFRDWQVEAVGFLDPNILDFADLVLVAGTAGQVIGLGDWRPKYGRFEATVERL